MLPKDDVLMGECLKNHDKMCNTLLVVSAQRLVPK